MGFWDDLAKNITDPDAEDLNPWALNLNPRFGSKSFFINGGYWLGAGTALGYFTGQGVLSGAELGAIGYGGLIVFRKVEQAADFIKDPAKAAAEGADSFLKTLYNWGHSITGDPGDNTAYERFVTWTAKNIYGIDDTHTLTKEEYQQRLASIKFTQDYQKNYGVPFPTALNQFLKEFPDLRGSKDPDIMAKFAAWSYITYIERAKVSGVEHLINDTADAAFYAGQFKTLTPPGGPKNADAPLRPPSVETNPPVPKKVINYRAFGAGTKDGVKYDTTAQYSSSAPQATVQPSAKEVASVKTVQASRPFSKLRFNDVTMEQNRLRSIARPKKGLVRRVAKV